MADLKIQQLDAIIPVVAGRTYLANSDLFLVKMSARGSAIADEDRKLTWAQLVSTLNLSQYMVNTGGTFTGDVTLNNTKAIQSNKATGASPVKLLYLDSQDRVMVGNATQQLRLVSPGIPLYIDPTGTASDFITTANLPAPGSLSNGGAYTKAEVNSTVNTLVAKSGSTMTGDLGFVNSKGITGQTATGTVVNLLSVDAGNSVNLGVSNLQATIKSVSAPKWDNGTVSVDMITTANLPAPGSLSNGGAYTKDEVNTRLADKLNLTGGTLTGKLKINNNQHLVTQSGASSDTPNVEVDIAYASDSALYVGDVQQKTILRGSNVLQHNDGTHVYDVFTTGNVPTSTQLGLDSTVAKAATALQPGAYGLGGVPNHKKDDTFLTTTDETLFFVQDGSATEQRFGGIDGNGGGSPGSESGLGAGLHIYYGTVGSGNATQYKSASLFIREDGKLVSKWSYLDYTGNSITTSSAVYYSNRNRPKPSDLGSGNAAGDSAYTRNESAARFAQKGINADITALNGLTGALKVGANANAPLEVTTLQQVQQMTSGTAGAVVGVVGGFVGAVMWFNGQRSKIPAGWAAGDGQTLSRTGYSELWGAVGGGGLESTTDANWIADVSLRGKYSDGDGSTTFRLPDLNGKRSNGDTVDGAPFTGNDSIRATVLRGDGGATIGTVQKSGVPNITGTINNTTNGNGYGFVLSNAARTGAFDVAPGPNLNGLSGNTSVVTARALTFNAKNSSDVYTDGLNEVRMNSTVGVWIIRVSSSFQAANTDFTVYNGMDSAPAADTPTEGGVLASNFSIGSVQNHSFRFSSQRNFGKDSYANLLVVQQASGGSPAKTANFKFGSDGKLTLGGDATENLQAVTKQQMEKVASGYLGETFWHDNRAKPVDGCVAADGQEVDQVGPFADLYADVVAGNRPTTDEATWQADPTKRGCYVLNSSTGKFRLPDRNGVQSGSFSAPVLRGDGGSLTAGAMQKTGVPNLTGRLTANLNWGVVTNMGTGTGVFEIDTATTTPDLQGNGQPNGGGRALLFKANKSSDVYTDGLTEVRMNASVGCYLIRYAGRAQNTGSLDAMTLSTRIESVNSDLQAKSVATNARMGYKLISIDAPYPALNSRTVFQNPFGNNTPVMCMCEIFHATLQKWTTTPWTYVGGVGSFGVLASYAEGEGVVLRTASVGYVQGTASNSGASQELHADYKTPSPMRIHVWCVMP